MLMRSSMRLPMSTFSIKKNDNLSEEVMDVSDATAFLLRVMEGVLTPLWDGEATWSHAGAEGVADGFPTTGVVGVAIC